jgi:hypothetical protein
MWNVVFWVMILCNLVDGYKHIGGVYHLHLQGIFHLGGTQFQSQRETEVGENMFLQNAGNQATTYRTVQYGVITQKKTALFLGK